MEYYYLTDTGKVRDHNEDSVTIVKNEANEYLLAVADGMGGHLCGEVASSIAITHVADRFRKLSSIGNKEDAISWIQAIVSEVNALIYKYTEEHPESTGMGTTFVCSIVTKDFLLYGNIGDSSGFAIKCGKLQKINCLRPSQTAILKGVIIYHPVINIIKILVSYSLIFINLLVFSFPKKEKKR